MTDIKIREVPTVEDNQNTTPTSSVLWTTAESLTNDLQLQQILEAIEENIKNILNSNDFDIQRKFYLEIQKQLKPFEDNLETTKLLTKKIVDSMHFDNTFDWIKISFLNVILNFIIINLKLLKDKKDFKQYIKEIIPDAIYPKILPLSNI